MPSLSQMYSQHPESAPMPLWNEQAMPRGSMLSRSHWKNSLPSSAQPWRKAAASMSPVLSGELMVRAPQVFQPYIQVEAPVQHTVALERITLKEPVGMWRPMTPQQTPSCTAMSVAMVWSKRS